MPSHRVDVMTIYGWISRRIKKRNISKCFTILMFPKCYQNKSLNIAYSVIIPCLYIVFLFGVTLSWRTLYWQLVTGANVKLIETLSPSNSPFACNFKYYLNILIFYFDSMMKKLFLCICYHEMSYSPWVSSKMTLSKGKNIWFKKKMLSNFLSEEKRTSVILQEN